MIPLEMDPEVQRDYSLAKATDEARKYLGMGLAPIDAIRAILYTTQLPIELSRDEIKNCVRTALKEGKKNVREVVVTSPVEYRTKLLAEIKSWGDMAQFRLGVPLVDEQYGGGIYPGEVAVLVGSEGSMKTSLTLHAIDDYLRHTKGLVLYFSLDMEASKVELRRIMAKMDCSEKMAIAQMVGNTTDYNEAIGELDAYDNRFLIVDGPWTLKKMVDLIRLEIPDVVVIDYLTAVSGYQSELECTRDVMPVLKDLARTEKITFFLLNQMSRMEKINQKAGVTMGNGMGGSVVEQRADFVFSLLKDAPIEGHSNLVLTVAKNRRGLNGKSFALEYRGHSMTFTGRSAEVVRQKPQQAVFEIPAMGIR